MARYIAIDTETTGARFSHGDRPYYISTCDDDDNIHSWEFPVRTDRTVVVPQNFLKEFRRVIGKKKPVFHNAKFDIQALKSVGIDFLDDGDNIGLPFDRGESLADLDSEVTEAWCPFHDTMIASHLWNSDGTHALKDLAYFHIDFGYGDEKNLIAAIKRARGLVQRHPDVFPYKIVRPEHKVNSGDGQNWLKMDSWLPAAIARTHGMQAMRYGIEQDELAEWSSVLSAYGNADAERTMGLWLFYEKLFNKRKPNHTDAPNYWLRYWESMQVIPAVVDMEVAGVPLHDKNLEEERTHYSQIVNEATAICQRIAEPFWRDRYAKMPPPTGRKKRPYEPLNLNSDPQLGTLLHEIWKLPVLARTDGGAPSMKAVVLKELRKVVADYTIEGSQGQKERDNVLTFLDNLAIVNISGKSLTDLTSYDDWAYPMENDGEFGPQPYRCIYPSYNPVGTKTTRFSSSSPNITNVSKGKEEEEVMEDGEVVTKSDFRLRRCFGPAPGRIWFAIDYQQLQLVIFAHMTNSETLKKVFREGKDIHDEVAREMHQTPRNESPTKLQRRAAKAVNFGIIFGAGDAKIDLQSGTPGTAARYRENLPGVGEYMKQVEAGVRKTGTVMTLGGYPLVCMKHKPYVGVCYIDQGTEGQIAKRAMVSTRHYLMNRYDYTSPGLGNLDVPFLRMMIHDELIFDFPQRPLPPRKKRVGASPRDPLSPYKEDVLQLKRLMELAALSIGVEAKCSVSVITDNWADAEELDW